MSPGTVSTERKRRYVNVQKPKLKKKILKNLPYTNTFLPLVQHVQEILHSKKHLLKMAHLL